MSIDRKQKKLSTATFASYLLLWDGHPNIMGVAMTNDEITEALTLSSLNIAIINSLNNITWASQSFLDLVNDKKELTQATNLLDATQTLFSDLAQEKLASAIASAKTKAISCVCNNPSIKNVLVYLGDIVEEHRVVTIIPQSITNQIRNNDEVDPLTGLGNRKMFERVLSSDFSIDKTAIIMIDLDHFKRINDTLGHVVGDKLLKLVSNRFVKLIRPNDNFIRLGGDEFVVIINDNVQLSRLKSLAQRFVVAASKTFVIQSQQINIGASVGIAVSDSSYKHSDELYRHADLALYESKQLGRSRLSVFNVELEQRAQYRRAIEIGLRRGLVKKEFSVLFIPQIDVITNDLSGFEAVLKWRSQELGLVEPQKFIPIAEDIGEINTIGQWSLEQAIQQAKSWPSHFTLSFSITLIQILEDDFFAFLTMLVEKHTFEASNLEIMLSEQTLMEQKAHKNIKILAASGFKIALDDPIARYESLRHLSTLPISRMRVHQDFAGHDDIIKDKTIKSIMDIGQMLGIPVVAQGINNKADFWQLKKHGFPDLQGFFTNTPLSVEEANALVSNTQK